MWQKRSISCNRSRDGMIKISMRNGYRRWFPKLLKRQIIWRLKVQS